MTKRTKKLLMALAIAVCGSIGIQPFDFNKKECDSPDC